MKKNLLILAILSMSFLTNVVGQDTSSSKTKKETVENQLLISCLELKKNKVDSLVDSGISLNSSKDASYHLYVILLKQMEQERFMSNFTVTYEYTNRDPKDIVIFKMLMDAGADPSMFKINEDDTGSYSKIELGSGYILHTGNATANSKIVSNSENGLSAIDYAIKNKLRDFIIILNKKPILFDAIESKNIQKINELIQKGEDVNAQDALGNTSLNFAVVKSNLEVIELLLSKGADINIKNKGGYSPLMSAVVTKDYELSKFIISKGADINTKMNEGISPLYYASGNNMVEMVRLLIDSNANVNITNNDELTPLVIAVATKNKKILNLLLDSNADITKTYTIGNKTYTIFEIAADVNDIEIIELLEQYQSKNKE